MNTLTLSIRTGGEPQGADLLRWKAEEFGRRQRFPNGNVLQSWGGDLMAEELPSDRPDSDTFSGNISWRKFRHMDGQVFYFGYGEGSPRITDYGVIEVVEG